MEQIKIRFESFLQGQHVPEYLIPFLVFAVLLVIAVSLIYLSVFLTKTLLQRGAIKLLSKTRTQWDDLLIKYKLFSALGYLVSVIVLKAAVPILFEDWPKTLLLINRLLDVYLVFVIIRLIMVFLRVAEEILSGSEVFIEKPLASYFQLVRIVLYIVGFILGFSILLNKSPVYFLGAFGAMTAVLLLVFKDTILGLVASIQISANDMVRIGDWIEMPKQNADGDVIAINLNTVKVSNWDKTITTVPTYFFITESFKNWRGMQLSGGRRIKRDILINIASIKFVDPDMRERFKRIGLISDYIAERQHEIEQFNEEHQVDTGVLINGRRMTNIGVFRMYIETYLKKHPGINQDMSLMVRQQPPNEHGLPLQIYCFTRSVKWVEHEGVQSDIFDHVFASAKFFDISIFQSPSGEDFASIGMRRPL